MKAEDLFLGAMAAGVVVLMGLVWKKTAEARDLAEELTAGPYTTPALNNAVRTHGGSYFTPAQQAVWAVPDDQLPQWANL